MNVHVVSSLEIPQTSLRLFSKIVCGSVVFLIFMGALVTSNDAGLAVPDWPTSFGENMFLFPPSKWRGIIFFEHVHRLIASVVGALTLVLAVWMGMIEPRRWLRVAGYVALAMVIVQGVLGGVTVLYQLPLVVSAAHGVIAQTFFLLVILITYSLSAEYHLRALAPQRSGERGLFRAVVIFGVLVYLQLIIGALMRHSEAGLAIPDFPLAAGVLIPTFNAETMARINEMRVSLHLPVVERAQAMIHLLHRFGGVMIVCALGALLFQARRSPIFVGSSAADGRNDRVRYMVYFLGYLVLLQFTLGVFTLMSVRHPLITSLHVVTGAVLLGVTMLLALRLFPMRGSKAERPY